MWLTNSSVGRKFVMSITGACLVLFVTFHVLMNSVAIIWPTAYNAVCEFLGANWYALIASAGLALLFIIHIIYALVLTVQNRAARGTDRYAVTAIQPQVEWSSKNMFVLGIVVVVFIGLHLWNFWAKMQLQELLGADASSLPKLDGVAVQPAMGTLFLQMTFSQWWISALYIVGFIALWFHMNHGFWSMFQTVGWNNNTWLPRLKCIAKAWTTIVIALFVVQVVVFTYRSYTEYYTENVELQEQYAETWGKAAKAELEVFQKDIQSTMAEFMKVNPDTMDLAARMEFQENVKKAESDFIKAKGQKYLDQIDAILKAYDAHCSKALQIEAAQHIQQLQVLHSQIETRVNEITPQSEQQPQTQPQH